VKKKTFFEKINKFFAFKTRNLLLKFFSPFCWKTSNPSLIVLSAFTGLLKLIISGLEAVLGVFFNDADRLSPVIVDLVERLEENPLSFITSFCFPFESEPSSTHPFNP